MDWREEIRRRREEKHLSQEELAEAVGVSRQAVSKWESGAGHLQILLDFGAEGIIRSEGAYNAAPLDPAEAA